MQNPFNATRYHSLIVDPKSINSDLTVTAKTKNNVIMAIEHKKLPIFESTSSKSIATDNGHLLLKNFLNIKKS